MHFKFKLSTTFEFKGWACQEGTHAILRILLKTSKLISLPRLHNTKQVCCGEVAICFDVILSTWSGLRDSAPGKQTFAGFAHASKFHGHMFGFSCLLRQRPNHLVFLWFEGWKIRFRFQSLHSSLKSSLPGGIVVRNIPIGEGLTFPRPRQDWVFWLIWHSRMPYFSNVPFLSCRIVFSLNKYFTCLNGHLLFSKEGDVTPDVRCPSRHLELVHLNEQAPSGPSESVFRSRLPTQLVEAQKLPPKLPQPELDTGGSHVASVPGPKNRISQNHTYFWQKMLGRG